jgi:LytS/YehU family sensor histidine kinase
MAENENIETRLDYWRRLSWGAIFFGAVVALAVATMLHILGVGIVASSVDPAEPLDNIFMTLGGVSGVWFIISTIVGLFIGGFVAANISRTFSDERALLYGLGVWAVSSLVTIGIASWMVLASASGAVTAAGNVAGTAAQAIGGTAQAIGSAGSQIAQNVNLPGNVLQQIEQTLTGGQRGQINPQGAQQIFGIIQNAVTQGRLNQAQREQLIQAVGNTFNIPPEEARQRVQQAENQINQTLANVQQTAREAADAALTAIATSAYWAFAAILLGGIAALIGARYGALDPQDLPRFVRTRMGGVSEGRT